MQTICEIAINLRIFRKQFVSFIIKPLYCNLNFYTMAVNISATKAPQAAPLKKKEVKALAPLFEKQNYIWMLIGAAIITIGMILLSGGKNPDPNTFDPNLVYSKTRITVAPILIVLGLLVEVYALFKKPQAKA